MSQVIPFHPRRPFPQRRGPGLRVVALLILLFFAAAAIWTMVASMGSYCLTSDSYAPLPRTSP